MNKIYFKLLFLLVISSNYYAQNLINFNGNQYIKTDGRWKFKDPNSGKYFNISTKNLSIRYKNSILLEQITLFENTNSLLRVGGLVAGWYTYKVNLNQNTIFQFVQSLQNSTLVEIVEIGTYGEYLTSPPNDSYYTGQWYLENANDHDIDILNAWDITKGSPTIKVGVIDGGMQWDINDLGMGPDSYQNINLNIHDPWINQNDPNSGNNLDEDDNINNTVVYPDDYKGWHFEHPYYWPNSNETRNNNGHGTRVASIISSKTNNGIGMSGIAGGWNGQGVQIIGAVINNEDSTDYFNYNSPISTAIPGAIYYCIKKGAKIINLSVSVGFSIAIDSAINYAWNNGVVIICAAGNANIQNLAFPAIHPKTISVTATNENDERWVTGFGGGNYGYRLDVAAPGASITSFDHQGVIGQYSGTSFSAPIVSGIVALMLSVNPCLSPEQVRQILRSTAEKVGGYNYNYNLYQPGRSYELGYGRVNAHQAVLAAQNMLNLNSDLYVRDHYLDYGPDACYPWTWDFDESPDIWVRNTNDGLINQTHSDYIHFYNTNGTPSTKYVYVRVTNSGCSNSSGTEIVTLNASAAGSGNVWPAAWNQISDGGQLIGSAPLPVIAPGQSKIVEIPWNLTFNVNSCILARIENETNDPIGNLPSDISSEIWLQNNIALRNVLIYDFGPMVNYPTYDGKEMPHGNMITFANPGNTIENFDFAVISEKNSAGKFISDEAEVTLTFDEASWPLFQNKFENNSSVKIIKDKTVQLFGDFNMNDIELTPGEKYTCFLGITFLTRQINEEDLYEINFVQKYSTPHPTYGDHWTGGLHFKLVRNDRSLYLANAGNDRVIDLGDSTVLTAVNIGEDAVYNWSVFEGDFVGSNQTITVNPTRNTTYQLEVKTSDGFKDYDQITVFVNEFKLTSIVPNPASGVCVIDYIANNVSNARLDFVGVNNSDFLSVPISGSANSTTVNISSLTPGIYSVVLVCDNVAQDVMQILVY